MKNKLIEKLTKNGEFSQQIDNYINHNLPTGDLLYLGNTPKILQDIGVYNNQIILKQSKLKTLLSKGG